MKFHWSVTLMLAALLVVSFSLATAQEEMNKEQWQQEVNKYTQQRTELGDKIKGLTSSIESLKSQSAKLDGDYTKAMDELYGLVGSDAAKAAEFRRQVDYSENTANDLMRLSDADLVARESEVNDLETKVRGLWSDKLSLIPEFWDRLTAVNEKITSLKTTLSNQIKTYTVGTWQRDRDCLWNISKKKDIYNNAWLWPKIWQGNRDQIKDPDVIKTGWKLKIPKGNELSAEEKTAAKKYYSKKVAATAGQ